MTLTQKTVHDFLGAVRSPDPTPGGGSASALSGAVGASLLAMVAGLARPRAATEPDLRRLVESGSRCLGQAQRLESLIDRDSAAYDAVLDAYRLPRGTDEEKTARTAAVQRALRAATDAPLDVMRACLESIRDAAVVAEFGNRNASSDVLVGLELLGAGLRGARLNVEINLGSVKDQAWVDGVRAEVQQLESDASAAAEGARRHLMTA